MKFVVTIILIVVLLNDSQAEWCISLTELPFSNFAGAGTYLSSDLSSDNTTCLDECFAMGMTYSLVWKNLYCFCANNLSKQINTTDSIPCLSSDGLMVSSAVSGSIITVFDVLQTNSSAVTGTNPIFFTPKSYITDPSNSQFGFKYSYQDRPGIWEFTPNQSPIQRIYSAPGVYQVRAQAAKLINRAKIRETYSEILVYETLSNINLTCQSLAVVYITANCTVMIGTGSYLKGTISVNGLEFEKINIFDFKWERIGSVPNFFNNDFISGSMAGINIINTVFQYDGVVSYVEFNARQIATIDILLLRPDCPASFCTANNICDPSSKCPRKLLCSEFCPLSICCSNVCNSRLLNGENITMLPINYIIDRSVTINILQVGYQIANLGVPWPVKAGHRLAFHSLTNNDVIAVTILRSGESSNFYSNAHTVTVGTSLTAASFTPINMEHQFSAISQPQRNLVFKIMFNTSGIKNVSINLQSVDNIMVSGSTSILVSLNINDTSFAPPGFCITNESCTFRMNPHTGELLQYYWTFGDNTTLNSTSGIVNHTFPAFGTYNASVYVYNAIVTKVQYYLVTVKDKVIINYFNSTGIWGPKVSANFNLWMISGTGFNCTLSGDLITNITQPSTNLQFAFQWPTDGYYNVRIDCYNEGSRDTKSLVQIIQSNVTGLAFTSLIGITSEPTSLQFTWSTGSNITFSVLINNVSYNFVANESIKLGSTENITLPIIGVYIGIIRAINFVSDAILVSNITYYQRITGLQFIPDKIYISNGSAITFTVNLTTGSLVTSLINFSDGTNQTFISSLYETWTNNYSVPHIFPDVGSYNVTVNCSNPVSSQFAYIIVYIITNLGKYTIQRDNQFFKLSDIIQLSLNRTSGTPALMTNLTINWQNANIVNIPYTSFNESAVYYNQYSTNGAYNVTFLLQNPLSTFVASVLITIMNPIVNFRCSYVPANTWNGNMMSLKTFADSGDNVVLTLNPGDGSASTVNTINITSINQEYDFNYTYNTVGNYSSNIWACNQLGCQNCSNYVQIQYKIIKTDFKYITSGNIEYINTNLTTTLTFSGTNFPTALTAIFNFSDGSPPLSLLLTSGMMPYTLMKNLSKPGFGVSTVILQNLANSENFTASYEAFVKYINVSVTVLWGPKKLIGFGSFLNIFPLNNYLYLRPNSQMIGTIVNGTVTYYDSKSSSTVLLCNSTFINGELNFTISSMGNVNLSLTLYNPIDTITSSLPIIIGSSIQNTEITTSPSTLLPGYYGFIIVTWSIISATNCICVDVADGRKFIYGATSGCEKCINYNYTNIAPVNNQISISVRYLIQGDYKINVSIYNSFESGNASRIISVTTNPCAPPTLLMTYPTYQNSFSPQTEIRSNQIIISGIVSDIPCTMTTTNYKLWTAVLIDPNYLTTMKEIDLSSIPTANNSQLIIPPRFLSYGLYKFTLTVTMDKSITVFTFQSSNFTFLQIVKSPLVVGLSSGGLTIISRSIQEDICFTPLIYSQDPDLNVQDFLNWNWVWTCQEKNEIMNTSNIVYPKPRNYQYSFPKTGCFGDGPGIVNFTTSPCFAGNNLDIDKMYMFNLTARAPDNRTGSSLINVRVVNGTSPNITIQCSRPLMCNINKNGQYAFNEVLFNPSDSLILSATCVCLNVICEKGFWSILNQVASSWETFNQTIVNSYVKGFNSLQMSLIPDFFTAYSNLTRIQICYNSDGLPTNGFGCIQFAIYPLPKGVTCQLNTNIIPQAANLCVNCTFYSDYQYRMFINNTGSILTLGYTGTGYLCSIVPYQPFAQAYMVRVTNSNGGFTDVLAGNVTVTQMTSQDLNSTINNLLSGADKSLQLAIAKANFQDMAQIYMKYISVLSVSNQNTLQTSNLSNIQPYLGGSGYLSQNVGPGVLVIDNLPADKRLLYEKDRDQKSSVINLMTSGLSSFVPGNIKSLYLASSVLSSFGDSSDCINRISQMQISNNLRNMAGYFQNLQGTATKEDILEIGKNLLQANFLSDTAANVQINDGILRDIQQSKDNYMDYDTNMYSKGKSYLAVSDPNQAGNSLVLETNANFQSKVASGIGSNAGQSINIIKRIMRSVMVVGDEPISFQTNNLHYVASKQVGSALKNKTFLAGRSVVQLPDICQSLNISPGNCSNPNNPISVEMIGTPNNIRSYLSNPNVDGLPIPSKSDYLTVNLYTGTNSSDISASPNDSQNFTIFVTRDPSFQIPDFNMSESDPQISPPKTIPGTGTLFSGPASFEQKLVVYTFTLSGTDQSIHFQMKSNFSINCTQYLVVGRLAQPPILGPNPDGTSDSINFTFWGMIPSDTKYCNMSPQNNEPDPFTFFVSNNLFKQSKFSALQSMPDYSKTLNTIYFGVRELTPPEWNSYTSNNRPPVPYTISAQINHTFRVRIFSSGCYFLSDDNKNSWGTNGCVVGPLTTPQKTQCICNHLTSFSSGWLVAPNAIDFNYIFSNFDFTKNVTLFATEIAIAVVFILLLVWARRQDIKDIEKVGLTPLASNDPKDMYLYEVIVDTSIRNNAGTTSNVYFILSGELNETDPTHLVDSKRKILKRGNVDRFLLAVPRSLGAMQFIRLWHDNSGKGTNASWYCNCLGIIDLQTKEKFNFLVNKWFAVEEDDGQIDRIIPVAGINELLYFQEMFSRKMKANLSEDHLWLSIIARPPESRFTRVERVACCLLLLFLTMLTTCMFYQTEGPSKPVSNILTIGPFALSAKELWTGFISNIIAFVPLFVLIELFRRSSLKHGYANLLREAVENHLQISLNSDKVKGYHSSTANLIWNEDLNISRPVSRSMGHINIQLNENDTEIDDMDVQEKETPVVRQKLFPWWMRIFAWTFLITLLIVASVLTTFYGIQFGDLACKKWISSMFISFFTSVLLVQPIKVICLAIFFALLCKDSSAFDVEYIGEEDEIMDELGRRNAIMQNEEYLHQELYTAPIKPHKICFRPPSQEEIEKARELRLKELQMYDVIREVGFYLAFFCTLLFISYSLRHPDAYDLQNELKNVFIKQAPDSSFTDITSETLFWNWILRVFVPRIRAPVWYNNDPPIFQRGFISNRNNRLIGYAIIRQVRSKKDSCKVNDYVKHLIKHCYSQYDIFNQDEKSYGFGWTELNTSDTSESPFLYSNESSLDGLPYIGRLSTYSGGGYVYKLKDDVNTLYNDLSALRDNKWIDFQTRAIFIEFTTFNPNINLFAIHTYVAEMPGNGGLWTIYRIEPANLLGLYSGGVKAFEIFCQVLYGIFILVIFVKEIRNFLKQKWKYFSQFWNFIELFIIFGSLLSAAGFAYVTIATNKLTGKFSQYGGSVYLNFAQVAFWNEYFSYLVSLIIFCATIKFIRVLRFNKRIGMLGAVLSYTATDMKQFFIIFFIMFLAFVMMFYSLFMDSLYRYHSFLFAIESSMNIPLGKFGFLELYQKAPIFGPIVFAGFVLFIVFVLLNMFVAILYNGFTVVKEDIDLQSSDHELMRFIFTKFVMWTGINDTKLGKKFIKTGITDQIYRDHVDSNEGFGKIDELQEKVEMILNCVNRLIYNDKRRNNINEKVFSSAIFNKSKPLIQDEFEANERIEKSRRILDVNKSGGLTPVYK